MPSNVVLTPSNVQQGPGNLWLDCAVPATGSRLLIDQYGNPVGGAPRNIGATTGALTHTMTPKISEIGAEQETAGIDATLDSDANEIDVTMEELTLLNLRDSFGVGIYASGTDAGLPAGAQDYEELSFGGFQAVQKRCIAVISPRRDQSGLYVVSCLYNAYSTGAVKLPFERSKPTTWAVKFKGLNVPTRPQGDKCGKIYRQI